MPICSERVCLGSLMTPIPSRKPDEPRTKEELLPLATDFIDQYFTSIKRQDDLATAAVLGRVGGGGVGGSWDGRCGNVEVWGWAGFGPLR